MSDTLKKTKLFDLPEGTAYSIRITNNTGDYIDFTNYGARLLDIYVHTPIGGMKNIYIQDIAPTKDSIESHPETRLFSGGPEDLNSTLWDIIAESEASILLSAESISNIKVGIRITWVNLNRLILDYFLTPKDASVITFSSCISFNAGEYEVSAFTNEVNGLPIEKTDYKGMTFMPLKSEGDVFSSDGEDMKPMLEIKDIETPLRLSFYSTMECAKAENANDHIIMTSFPRRSTEVMAGETLTERVICGIDYITTNLASDENDPESPFMGFF